MKNPPTTVSLAVLVYVAEVPYTKAGNPEAIKAEDSTSKVVPFG